MLQPQFKPHSIHQVLLRLFQVMYYSLNYSCCLFFFFFFNSTIYVEADHNQCPHTLKQIGGWAFNVIQGKQCASSFINLSFKDSNIFLCLAIRDKVRRKAFYRKDKRIKRLLWLGEIKYMHKKKDYYSHLHSW